MNIPNTTSTLENLENIVSKNAATALFMDIIKYVNKGRYFDFVANKTGQSLFFKKKTSRNSRRHIHKVAKTAIQSSPGKVGHSATMLTRKMARNKIKLVKETGEVIFIGAGIGLSVGSVIIAATAVESMGVGAVVGASIGLGISVFGSTCIRAQ